MLTRVIERNRPAAIAAAVLAAVLVTAVPFLHSSHERKPPIAPPDTAAASGSPVICKSKRARAPSKAGLRVCPRITRSCVSVHTRR